MVRRTIEEREELRVAHENLVTRTSIEPEGKHYKAIVHYDGIDFVGLGVDKDSVRTSLLQQLWQYERDGRIK